MSKNILITGASNGIGRATALKYANSGFNIAINCDKDSTSLKQLESEILNLGVECCGIVKDISQFDEVHEMFDILSDKKLIPDIIVNNAGISYIGLLQDMPAEDWQRVINVNLSSVYNVCRLAIPHFLQKHMGKIINISSMWGNVGASCETAYSASKGGVNTFTKALAKELAPSNIQVNAIAFGAVDTRMNSFLSKEEYDMLKNEIPAGYILPVEKAAEIIYTASLLDNYVTGQIITADGGMT